MRSVTVAAVLLSTALALQSVAHATPPAGAATALVAPHCAASVQEAARDILGDAGRGAKEGYRVQDLLVDPVLGKAWLRVADCQDARRPLTLVPLQTNVASSHAASMRAAVPADSRVDAATNALPATAGPVLAPLSPMPSLLSSPSLSAATAAAPVLIARGDAVQVVVEGSNVRMLLEGHAASAAAAGDSIDVVLDTAAGTPAEPAAAPRHLRGVAAGPHRVEVQR